MSKRITSAILLVSILSIAPVAAAAPAEQGADPGGPLGLVQAMWSDLARFLGLGTDPSPPESEVGEAPRSVSACDDVGPTIDP